MSDAIFGFAAALLSGLGIGSGGLLVIYLTLAENYEQITAQGLNLLFFLFSSGAAMLFHVTKRKINYSTVLFLVIFALFGVLIGTLLLKRLGGEAVRRVFGIMLVFSGIVTLKRQTKS